MVEVDNKKELERAELHKTIWNVANDLRGSVDGWDFKAYVLGFLFYRYISENFTNYINKTEHDANNLEFDYVNYKGEIPQKVRDSLIETKGFFIKPEELFVNVYKRINSSKPEDVEYFKNLNVKLSGIFKNIEESAKDTESEKNFSGLFTDVDVSSNKLGSTVLTINEKLKKIINSIYNMKLGDYQDNTIDAFGDAYEYLMGMYASNAGKSGGEFFTPQEVSELLTKLAIIGKTEVNKVYDPACGSGSLLLQTAKILGKDKVKNGFFGQELNPTTYNLCRINMFLHDIDYDKFSIANDDTLLRPAHWDDEPFEVIVSNPPYSTKWIGDDDATLINDDRFKPAAVLAPKSKADLAFIMHSLAWLSTDGVASIVCFPGIMYRGGAEQKIRKYLIDHNFIDSIIQLPGNLFFGTSIPTCIMILKKSKLDNKVLFINATKYCVKVTNSNKLSQTNIDDIIKIYIEREDKEYISTLVSNDIIGNSENKYNLSVGTYVKQEDTSEKVDIQLLNKQIDEIVEKENQLRKEINEIIKELENDNE